MDVWWLIRGRKRREEAEVGGNDMEMKNLKLYMENISILEENDKLRKKASLLHQENLALISEFQRRSLLKSDLALNKLVDNKN